MSLSMSQLTTTKSRLHLERPVNTVARKKIVFVIVEGPSDEEALGVVLSRLYSNEEVYVHIMHGDITSEFIESPNENIFTKVANEVEGYAKSNHYKKLHFKEIIHIVDTDGTFIPDANVTEDLSAETPVYTLKEIQTKNKSGIEERNRRKSNNIMKLCSRKSIWGVPYQIYYMSCNLDHVLYNKLNSSDEDKEIDAFKFAKFYKDRIPEFVKFISESDFSVTGDYRASWNFIKQDLNSLKRYTNLAIGLPEIKEEAKK